jgi:transposase-like protein/IS1 family transposase
MTCHCCNGETKKFGKFKNKNRLVQRYRCERCAKTFSEAQPMDGLRVDFKQSCQVVNMLCEGMGIRAISRLTGFHQVTVLNILETAGQKAAAFLDEKIRNVNADVIQADEVHSFVYSKQRNTPKEEIEHGDQFTFLSVDRNSKLIINYKVGKRTNENATDFLADLKNRMVNRFQLTTDNWKCYSGLDGGAVANVFGNGVDYATETKFFAKPGAFLPRRLIGIRRKSKIGKPNIVTHVRFGFRQSLVLLFQRWRTLSWTCHQVPQQRLRLCSFPFILCRWFSSDG